MRKIYIRDTACFVIGAWVTWYQVTEDKDNVMAWLLAAVLMSGPAALNIFARALQSQATTGSSESSQEPSRPGA